MTRYQRISPEYEARIQIEFEQIGDNQIRNLRQVVSLTNTTTGERSVITQEEFEREFRRVEG